MKCHDSIVVRVLGWHMKVPGSIPADVNYTSYATDTSKSLGECLRLRSNRNLYLSGRLAESKENIYLSTYAHAYVHLYCMLVKGIANCALCHSLLHVFSARTRLGPSWLRRQPRAARVSASAIWSYVCACACARARACACAYPFVRVGTPATMHVRLYMRTCMTHMT